MLTFNRNYGTSIAKVQGGKHNGKVLRVVGTADMPKNGIVYSSESEDEDDYNYLNDSDDEGSSNSDFFEYIKLTSGKFVPYPDDNPKNDRQCSLVSAPSGFGKSHYVNEYLKNFKKIYKKRKVILVSTVRNDKAFKETKDKIQRLEINDENFLENPIWEDEEEFNEIFKDSLVIFDDIDTVDDPALQRGVHHLINKLLQTGRHLNSNVIITNHMIFQSSKTRIINAECHLITQFLGTGVYHTKRFLKTYCGLDNKKINRILNMRSRYFTLYKKYPMAVFSETEAFIV